MKGGEHQDLCKKQDSCSAGAKYTHTKVFSDYIWLSDINIQLVWKYIWYLNPGPKQTLPSARVTITNNQHYRNEGERVHKGAGEVTE